MEEEEALARVAPVEGLDPRSRRGQDLVVAGIVALGRVPEVAQDREVDVGIEVAERLHLEMLQQVLDAGDAAEQRRNDHHRPRALGNAGFEVQPRQPARRHQRGDDALNQLAPRARSRGSAPGAAAATDHLGSADGVGVGRGGERCRGR